MRSRGPTLSLRPRRHDREVRCIRAVAKIATEVGRYLRTGDADIEARAWPGDIFERGKRQHADLCDALVREVRRLASGRAHAPVAANVGNEFTRAKVEPMVRGLLPRDEQNIVLATFEKSVVYVTSETVEPILRNERWERSAWDLDYLGPDFPDTV